VTVLQLPDAEEPLLPTDAVLWAFRMLLGREPEAEEVERHRRHASPEALRQALMPGYAAPLWLIVPPESSRIPWRLEPPTLRRPVTQLATVGQCEEADYATWCAFLGESPRPHRKQWEFCWILAVLRAAGAIRPGARLLGFGVGTEPIPAMLATQGATVTSTDAPPELAAAEGWTGGDPAADAMANYRDGLLEEARFRERVTFRPADMKAIPEDLRDFDACWSAAALGHLGGLEAGLEFVERSLDTLRPGGVSVHTAEFNLASDEHVMPASGPAFLRRRDVEALMDRLAANGHRPWPLNLHPGSAPGDAYVDRPPYGLPHIKVESLGQVNTSIGLVVQKAGG